MNLDKYIKQLIISLSTSGTYYDISIITFEKYNEEYKTVTRSIELIYTAPDPAKPDEYSIQYKEWFKSKRELVTRLSELWQKREPTKNKKK